MGTWAREPWGEMTLRAAVGLWKESFRQDGHCSRGGLEGLGTPSHNYEAGKYSKNSRSSFTAQHARATHLRPSHIHHLKGKTMMCDQEPQE